MSLEDQVQILNSVVRSLEDRIWKLEKKLQEKTERSPKKRKIDTFPPHIISFVKQLYALWPKVREDGGKIQNDTAAACANVQKILDTTDTLIEDLWQSCEEYLDSRPGYPNAIQFYFGPGKNGSTPRWEIELRGYMARKASRPEDYAQDCFYTSRHV